MPENTTTTALSTGSPVQAPKAVLGGNDNDSFEKLFDASANLFLDNDSGDIFFGEDKSGAIEVDEKVLDDNQIASNNLKSTEEEAKASPLDSKITALESTIEKLSQIVVGLVNGTLTKPVNSQEPDNDEVDFDFSDPKAFQKIIKSAVADAVEQATMGVKQDMQETKLRQEFSFAQAKYGADFQNKLPMIAQLMKTDPEKWSFDSAYGFVKTLAETMTPPKDSSVPNNGGSKVVDARALVDRANALKSEADVSSSPGGQTRRVKSVSDAVDLAFEQLGLQ